MVIPPEHVDFFLVPFQNWILEWCWMVLNWQVRPGSSSRSRSPREVGHLCVSKAGCHMESHGMGQDLVSKNIIDGSKKLIFKGVSCEFWRSFTLICTRSPRSCWFVFMSKTQTENTDLIIHRFALSQGGGNRCFVVSAPQRSTWPNLSSWQARQASAWWQRSDHHHQYYADTDQWFPRLVMFHPTWSKLINISVIGWLVEGQHLAGNLKETQVSSTSSDFRENNHIQLVHVPIANSMPQDSKVETREID